MGVDEEATVTGWRAVTAALSDYASKAREIGGDIGQSLVGAFQSAENAVGQFAKTGKLNFRDLVTSLLADLAQLAPRRFILGPIANALSGLFSGAGGIFANVLHAGGMVGSAGPSRMVPAMAFAAAPRRPVLVLLLIVGAAAAALVILSTRSRTVPVPVPVSQSTGLYQ